MRVPALVAFGLLLPSTALAHIQLSYPPQRTEAQKVGPCGESGSARGDTVTELPPGATIEVTWTEPVNHPSHFRISFDTEGEDFTVPPDYDDFSADDNVLVDAIADNGAPFTQTITLPDVECEGCTLQLIQVMYDKEPYGDGNDLYFQCADITLRSGATPPDPADPGDPGEPSDDPSDPNGSDPVGASGGCSTNPGEPGMAWVLLAVALLFYSRRSRPERVATSARTRRG